jgi:DNA-binding beta-propeller fold protein YncE
VFLAAWQSPVISVADATAHKVIREVGPFGSSVCPFTVNGRGTLAFANVDGLVGFEVADLQTGMLLDRVIVEGSDMEAWPRYECPSHGIALTPDERELWVADGVANRLHVFDATTYPPVPSRIIPLHAQPRWMIFSVDGRFAYASTGDVIETASGKVVAVLDDERGITVRSEKMIEIDFAGGRPIRAGRQTAAGGRL